MLAASVATAKRGVAHAAVVAKTDSEDGLETAGVALATAPVRRRRGWWRWAQR